MSMRNRTLPRRSGFTLIELLLAVAIAALLAAALYAAHSAAIRILERSRLRTALRAEAADALDRLGADLAGAVLLSDRADDRFLLEPGSDRGGASELTLSTTRPPEEPDLSWYTIERVRYVLRNGTLVRIARPNSETPEAARPATNLLARHVRAWRIEARAGGEWVDRWPAPDGPPLPSAARVRIEVGPPSEDSGYTLSSEFFIPGGAAITSSVVRTGTVAQ